MSRQKIQVTSGEYAGLTGVVNNTQTSDDSEVTCVQINVFDLQVEVLLSEDEFIYVEAKPEAEKKQQKKSSARVTRFIVNTAVPQR